MKKFVSNKKGIYIAILLCFILGHLGGTYAIKQIFLNYKLKDLFPLVSIIAADMAEGAKNTISKKADPFILKAYDLNGNEIETEEEKGPVLFDIDPEVFKNALTEYIPQVLIENKWAEFKNISGLPSKSVVVGTPIVRNGKATGVVFLLEPSSEFQAVLNGFYLVFTATLLLGTMVIGYFLSSYVKEMKLLENVRRDYITNISHELKSPITSIRALTETLADGMIQNEEKKNNYYSIILTECARLQRLIGDVLELSKMQYKKEFWDKQKLSSNELIAFIVSKYSLLADEMGLAFEISDRAKNLPDVYSNWDKIIQLLSIIIDNAMKFVHEDGKITLDATIHSKYITIFVSDNGTGIAEEDLTYMFERFYKSEKSHNGNGSGLGLSIAREIVNGLGEKLEVKSRWGEGTMFLFTIRRF
ncbi:HAMP domain-containing sensor histidine kinase [Paenibacillus kribbensis]|uniref:sensor histidine kinase n=1 Tax=Paenibacillus kribbensis TaxID=172713 RepID=UPI002DB95936|nr:HAMP domain-containing sensor histidine kinase [Paenibacillus kribbensis]MEC0233793.1 HAMP domain-containing sensor histidine kinase [Paenibacillus kribbensis]